MKEGWIVAAIIFTVVIIVALCFVFLGYEPLDWDDYDGEDFFE
jgi:hypothetical protein